ncbi:MAG: AMP-binding protein, partial [Solirubrobacteraceae bacterium]
MSLLSGIETRVLNVGTLISSGLIRPMRPDHLVRFGRLYLAWGPTPALGYMVGAMTRGDETAVIDELGALTFDEMNRRTNALAHAWADVGINEGDRVAVMCRNHRGFIDATVALSKLGAHCLYLNTSFAGPQITDVVTREEATAIVYDQEFGNLIADAAEGRRTYLAWQDPEAGEPDGEVPDVDDSLEHLIRRGDPTDPVPPSEPGKTVILTSGTTGTPKGASRQSPTSLDPAGALLSKIPVKAGEVTMVAAPLFHAWGFAHFVLGMGMGSTLVLRRKFDPEQTLAATAEHRATTLVVVPVMLQRILEVPEEVRDRYDLRALRVIAVSGSALPGQLATATMDAFGDIVYNLYGSTEVAWATIATPEDLRAAPGCAGRPPRGTIVKLYDEDGREVPQGDTARIFVGNEMMFEGYTGGGSKEVINGLMATGDVGHFDRGGRLHVDGRDDDMIVSGGENVFPAEVE